MPLTVLSADALFGPDWPSFIAKGLVPPDTPLDLGDIIDRAHEFAQNSLATLVPNAKHITDTHSGHNIQMEQPQLVIDAIRGVVDTIRSGTAAPAP